MMLPTSLKPHGRTVFEAILARRSVRAYTQEKLDRNTIQTLLEAAVRAPTAMHEEPWAFVVVQDRVLLQRLSDLSKPLFVEELRHSDAVGHRHSFDHFSRPDFNIFHGANTLIIICAKLSGTFVVADCWLAAENLMLVACDMGLGTCVIGSSVSALNMPKMKFELGIPDDYTAFAPIIVGIPKERLPLTARKLPLVLAWKQ